MVLPESLPTLTHDRGSKMAIDNPSTSADPVSQLRALVQAIDPSALTGDDRRALLDLFERSHAASAARLAHVQSRATASWLIHTVTAADEIAAWTTSAPPAGSGTGQ
jgi:hypothetical protein